MAYRITFTNNGPVFDVAVPTPAAVASGLCTALVRSTCGCGTDSPVVAGQQCIVGGRPTLPYQIVQSVSEISAGFDMVLVPPEFSSDQKSSSSLIFAVLLGTFAVVWGCKFLLKILEDK